MLPRAALAADDSPKAPRFSLEYMDRAVSPGAFNELQERNWQLIRSILESCAAYTAAAPNRQTREVGAFFASVMDTNRIEQLGFKPLSRDLKRIARLRSTGELFRLLADFHQRSIGGLFHPQVEPDARNSSIYALRIAQGGLGLPDRDYYLKDVFAKQREAYRAHITTMLKMLGELATEAAAHAGTILEIETALARASKPRADLRDPAANYHKFTIAELERLTPVLPWKTYLRAHEVDKIAYLVVGQPEFLQAEDGLVKKRPLAETRKPKACKIHDRTAFTRLSPLKDFTEFENL